MSTDLQQWLWGVGALVAAYLVGSLSFAVIVSRLMGLADPRSYGSKNPGATNVLRSGNRKAAVLTLLFDALKGYVPVALAVWFGPRVGIGESLAAFIGLAAFLGHLWPVFFRFQGGKGVATAAGVLLGLNLPLGGLVLMTWLVVAYLSRYSSLAAIVAALVAPLYDLLLWDGGTPAIAIIVMSLLLIWRHFGNIQKLIAGTESKIGQKPGGGTTLPMHPSAHHHSHHHKRKGAK
ncbi:MAG: glycerol-3-phosphate 1-O-acyltransferase PlsY [Pseudomonadota bacterium]